MKWRYGWATQTDSLTLKNCKIMAVIVKKATKKQCKEAAKKMKKAAESFKERVKERENEAI